jgi:hypothetical protein
MYLYPVYLIVPLILDAFRSSSLVPSGVEITHPQVESEKEERGVFFLFSRIE